MHRHILKSCGRRHVHFWCLYHVMGSQGESIIANLVYSAAALMRSQRRASLIRLGRFMAGPGFSEACSVGAGECESRLNVPRQCWAGGFICSDRLLTVCDVERQLRVGARHRLFSWQCELWRPEGARACISRPPLLLIPPSEVPPQRPQTHRGVACMHLKPWVKMMESMNLSALTSVSASWISLVFQHLSMGCLIHVWLKE